MNVQFRIFAKYGTNEKLMLPVPADLQMDILTILNKKYGGSWLYVDALKPGEGIRFSDHTTYRGFSPDIIRYSDAIERVV